MEDDVVKISELEETTDFTGLYTIGSQTDGQGNVVSRKVSLEPLDLKYMTKQELLSILNEQ